MNLSWDSNDDDSITIKETPDIESIKQNLIESEFIKA